MASAETMSKTLGGRRKGGGWMARWPAHDDRNPSLPIRDANDGKVLVRCYARLRPGAGGGRSPLAWAMGQERPGCRVTALDKAIAKKSGDTGGRGPTQADILIEGNIGAKRLFPPLSHMACAHHLRLPANAAPAEIKCAASTQPHEVTPHA